MSFWKKLFSSSSEPEAPAKAVATAEHKGFVIEAMPYKEQGQWQLAGVISKDVNGERKEHRFIRADRFTDRDEAAQLALSKARQIIDEQGERLFK